MATLHHTITGELTQELIAAGDNERVSSIHITNTRSTHLAIVDLYIEKKLTGKFYIMKGVRIPAGVSLEHDFSFDNESEEFGLYIKLTKTTTITLTGSINPGNSTTTVPGSGTAFLSEVAIGDELVVTSETKIVTAIASDTSLTVDSTFSDDIATDSSPDINPVAHVDIIIK